MPLTEYAGCRRRCLPTAGPPMPGAQQQRGRLHATARDHDRRRLHRELGLAAVIVGDRGRHAHSAPILGQHPVRAALHDAPRAGVGGVLQPRLHRGALAAVLATHRAVAAELRVVGGRRVAHDRPVLETERVEALHQQLVGAVLASHLGVRAEALRDHVDVVALVLRRVEPVEAVLRPLVADVLRRPDAVHVVDDRPAAERRPGEHRDRAVLGGQQAAAEVELEHAGDLELLEVRLVAIGAHLEHEHRQPGLRAAGGDHRPARPGADHAHVGGQHRGGARHVLDADRLRRLGRAMARASWARDIRAPPSSG